MRVRARLLGVMGVMAVLLAAAGVSSSAALPAPSVGSISGKLWVVSPTQAASATFPAPSAVPDATFTTNGITYIGQNFGIPKRHCFTIGKFLGGCATPVFGLTFSGIGNPNLGGAAATATTPMGGSAFGVIIEFTGSASLTNGKPIQILHDDGVSLKIDGTAISGYTSGITPPVLEGPTFTGTTGTHSFDLLYANHGGTADGAWLLFFPKLF